MTNCKLCKEEIKGTALMCSKGTICMRCSKDIGTANYQPLSSFDAVLWTLSEVFFRRGKGEDVSFEKIWKENDNLKLVRFDDLISEWKKKNGGK